MFLTLSRFDPRWCQKRCRIQPGQIQLTFKDDEGQRQMDHAVLWPWDVLNYLYSANKLEAWIYDPPERASFHVTDTWVELLVKLLLAASFKKCRKFLRGSCI